MTLAALGELCILLENHHQFATRARTDFTPLMTMHAAICSHIKNSCHSDQKLRLPKLTFFTAFAMED